MIDSFPLEAIFDEIMRPQRATRVRSSALAHTHAYIRIDDSYHAIISGIREVVSESRIRYRRGRPPRIQSYVTYMYSSIPPMFTYPVIIRMRQLLVVL